MSMARRMTSTSDSRTISRSPWSVQTSVSGVDSTVRIFSALMTNVSPLSRVSAIMSGSTLRVIKMPPRQQNKHLPRGLFAIPRPLLQRVSTRE
jgi:hypothetical protein